MWVERVVIDPEHPKRATEEIKGALAANAVVSITAISRGVPQTRGGFGARMSLRGGPRRSVDGA